MITRRLASGPFLPRLLVGAFLIVPLAALAAEKTETWIEVRSPHFGVVSNGAEKQARRVADQFEQIRAVFQKALPGLRVDPGQPILILAARNENTLKALLPEYWERKGHMHPAGIFLAGPEKHYVALRLDASGENPYHTIYHEYVHMLVRLNYRHLPVWLNEGIAEFYGNTTIGNKKLLVGQPDAAHVELLRTNKLLPLEVLLQVGQDSPHYNEANKASIFYAESWAVVHFLMLEPEMRKTQPLATFSALLQKDVEELQAARQALGDFKQLQKRIESYVRQPSFLQFKLESPAQVGEKDFVARPLTPAESAAARGDFHLHRQRMAEAQSLLEEALRLDPNLALAHEGIGQLHLRLGEREGAARAFAQAVQLDSRSYLAHYFHAMLMVEGSPALESLAKAESSLRRAIELNPNFAPAYASLAGAYSTRAETLEKALAAARKAVELEPGEIQHHLSLGFVLLRMDRLDEARTVGQRALAAAKSPEVRAAAESFLHRVASHQEELAASKRYDEQVRAAREQLPSRLRTESGAQPPADPASPAEPTQPLRPPGTGAASRRQYSMFGKITELGCPAPPAMELTLGFGGITMRLHAVHALKLDYLTTSWKPPANFNPCVHLQGLSAQVSYTLVQGQPYDGEIVSIEVRK